MPMTPATASPRVDGPVSHRLIAKSADVDGCRVWRGALTKNGYGRLKVDGRMEYAHRVSYETFVEPLPAAMQVDHLCRNRRCILPAHLEAVTQRENLLRGSGWAGRNAAKTHCPKGHPLSGENLYVAPATGARHCRACRAERRRG